MDPYVGLREGGDAEIKPDTLEIWTIHYIYKTGPLGREGSKNFGYGVETHICSQLKPKMRK